MEKSTEMSQEVINVMVIQNSENIEKLNGSVFGNGKRGMDEIVRGMERDLSSLLEKEKKEAEESKKFRNNILLTIGGLGLGGLATFAVTMIRVYPVLVELANNVTKLP